MLPCYLISDITLAFTFLVAFVPFAMWCRPLLVTNAYADRRSTRGVGGEFESIFKR